MHSLYFKDEIYLINLSVTKLLMCTHMYSGVSAQFIQNYCYLDNSGVIGTT